LLDRYWATLQDGGTRDDAVDAMLDDVDLSKLEEAWITSVK